MFSWRIYLGQYLLDVSAWAAAGTDWSCVHTYRGVSKIHTWWMIGLPGHSREAVDREGRALLCLSASGRYRCTLKYTALTPQGLIKLKPSIVPGLTNTFRGKVRGLHFRAFQKVPLPQIFLLNEQKTRQILFWAAHTNMSTCLWGLCVKINLASP